MTAHGPRTDDTETTVTIEMTVVTAIVTTETTIMIVMTMIEMTGMIEGTPVTIGATEAATPAFRYPSINCYLSCRDFGIHWLHSRPIPSL